MGVMFANVQCDLISIAIDSEEANELEQLENQEMFSVYQSLDRIRNSTYEEHWKIIVHCNNPTRNAFFVIWRKTIEWIIGRFEVCLRSHLRILTRQSSNVCSSSNLEMGIITSI